MNNWTPRARAVLELHLNRHRSRFSANGAEADEVIGDLRQHLENEAVAQSLTIVTEGDVRRLLAKVDPDLLLEPTETVVAPSTAESTRNRMTAPAAELPVLTSAKQFWLTIFGILLPLGTLVFELLTGACAAELFDPLPSWLHVFLVALVPAAHALALGYIVRRVQPIPWWLLWLQSVALGVAGAYALVLLPVFPIAVIGILFFGAGLVPLSPLLAWFCGRSINQALRGRAQAAPSPWSRRLWLGWLGSSALLVGLAAPSFLTRQWSETAAVGSDASRLQAIRRLRFFGSEETLLRACYGPRRRDFSSFLNREGISAEQAQEVYFRVTGQPFNAVRPPLSPWLGVGREVLRDFEWDQAVGGEAVAGHVSGLSLVSSRLDAKGNADDGWAYTEWILEFRNDHERQAREARAEIQLPPGGVVSRVTLWVNGEEREAAFAGRGEVRAAYQQVAVVQRRDPILVTTSGPDRVLIQCFPVPLQGGTMKIRLGITAPLAPLGPEEVAFVWPRLAERNFAIREELRHHAWLETPQPVVSAPVGWSLDASRSNAWHAAINERDTVSGFPIIHLHRTASETSEWVRDDRAPTPAWLRQRLNRVRAQSSGRLALVLDGGRGGRAWLDSIHSALKQVGGQGDLGLWIAHDGVIEVAKVEPGSFADVAAQLAARAPTFAGGHDPVPALEAAWDWASARPGGAVLWVHGPQPVLLGDFQAIAQRLERTGGTGSQLLDLQVGVGPNRAAKAFGEVPGLLQLARLGSVTEDLTRWLRERNGTVPQFSWKRERVESDPKTKGIASRHLARLWALDRIEQLRRERRVSDAVELAGRWQLVTPVSGAVVLETKAQFAQAGLSPVDPLTTPAVIPEPGAWALLGVGGVILWLASRRPRR